MSDVIYATEHGDTEVRYVQMGNCSYPVQDNGWRKLPDGTREEVFYREGFGWRSDTEINSARVEARTFR
jgi:hypothetical protein